MSHSRFYARRIAARLTNREEAVMLLILGLFFGTLFTFGMSHWQRAVTMDEAIPVTAAYQGCKPSYNRGNELWDNQPQSTLHTFACPAIINAQ